MKCMRDWNTSERKRWLAETGRNMDRLARHRRIQRAALTIAYVEGLTHGTD